MFDELANTTRFFRELDQHQILIRPYSAPFLLHDEETLSSTSKDYYVELGVNYASTQTNIIICNAYVFDSCVNYCAHTIYCNEWASEKKTTTQRRHLNNTAQMDGADDKCRELNRLKEFVQFFLQIWLQHSTASVI